MSIGVLQTIIDRTWKTNFKYSVTKYIPKCGIIESALITKTCKCVLSITKEKGAV